MRVITVYGPQASGKTRNAEALAKLFGCNSIHEGRLGGHPYQHPEHSDYPALVLANAPEWEVGNGGDSFIHIDLALRLLENNHAP